MQNSKLWHHLVIDRAKLTVLSSSGRTPDLRIFLKFRTMSHDFRGNQNDSLYTFSQVPFDAALEHYCPSLVLLGIQSDLEYIHNYVRHLYPYLLHLPCCSSLDSHFFQFRSGDNYCSVSTFFTSFLQREIFVHK